MARYICVGEFWPQCHNILERPIRILVAIAVLTHALFGCCVHHAHGANCSGDSSCHVAALGAEHCSSSCNHRHPIEPDHQHPLEHTFLEMGCDGDDNNSPVPQDTCDEGDCQWVVQKSNSEIINVLCDHVGCYLSLVDSIRRVDLPDYPAAQRFLFSSPCPLPVRAHLAKGVLLI